MSYPYQNEFSWTSPHGRMVGLLRDRTMGDQVVLDLGCGVGPLAEQVRQFGAVYVGCDVDRAPLKSLQERGFEVHQIDLSDTADLSERIRKVADGRSVGSILMLDVLEHLPDPKAVLRELCIASLELNRPLLGLSIPNVAHFDVGAKLLFGRWDVTTTGLLDETHVVFFTGTRLSDMLETFGWFEVQRDDLCLHHSDQHFPEDHPALRNGASLHDLLRALRDRIGEEGQVNQFVRLYALAGPVSKPSEQERRETFLSVVMRTQGLRMHSLLDALVCLAAQTDESYEVLLLVHHPDAGVVAAARELVSNFAPEFSSRVGVYQVPDGGRARPLNIALRHATGRYLAFLDDDDLVTADWVERFRQGAELAPGRVIRSITVDRPVFRISDERHLATHVVTGPLQFTHAATFDPLEHLSRNRTPNCSFAVPLDAVKEMGIRFDENLTVMEDWAFLLEVSLLCGVHDTHHVTSIYNRWEGIESSLGSISETVWEATRHTILQRLDERPLLLPRGSVSRIAELWERCLAGGEREALEQAQLQVQELSRAVEAMRAEIQNARQQVEKHGRIADDARREAEAIRTSTTWQLTYPLRRMVSVWHNWRANGR